MSLRRALRIAGAETVLPSHWKVSDETTQRLMTEFMGRWRAGEPRVQAWRCGAAYIAAAKRNEGRFLQSLFLGGVHALRSSDAALGDERPPNTAGKMPALPDSQDGCPTPLADRDASLYLGSRCLTLICASERAMDALTAATSA
jgi:hypothetical protein